MIIQTIKQMFNTAFSAFITRFINIKQDSLELDPVLLDPNRDLVKSVVGKSFCFPPFHTKLIMIRPLKTQNKKVKVKVTQLTAWLASSYFLKDKDYNPEEEMYRTLYVVKYINKEDVFEVMFGDNKRGYVDAYDFARNELIEVNNGDPNLHLNHLLERLVENNELEISPPKNKMGFTFKKISNL